MSYITKYFSYYCIIILPVMEKISLLKIVN